MITDRDREDLAQYLEGVIKRRSRRIRICKTKNLGKEGYGLRRSCSDKHIEGKILGSFSTYGGGGYFIRRKDNGRIIQVQSFRTK